MTAKILQIVIDTNILVAGFRSRRGAANLLLGKLDDPRWRVNVSTPLLLEYEDVLKRPEMSMFVSPADVDTFLDGLCSIAAYNEIFYLWRLLAKDPNDAFLLELAVRARGFSHHLQHAGFSRRREFRDKLSDAERVFRISRRLTMTSIETKIPDALYRQAQAIAQREDITLDELIAIALASQVSVWQARQTFTERAIQGDWEKARQILANAPDEEPEDRDKL